MDGVNFKRHKVSRDERPNERGNGASATTDLRLSFASLQEAVSAARKAQYDRPAVEYQEHPFQGMDVDVPASVAEEGGRKRKAEEEEGGDAKKPRAGEYSFRKDSASLSKTDPLITHSAAELAAEPAPLLR